MTQNTNASHLKGVLSRLAGNEEGNIIALLAVAVIPLIGLVGAGIDIGRIYLTNSRLQGACDAGALLGRKVMGVGRWNADDGAANEQALQIFDQNFAEGAYGSLDLRRSYSESGGNVRGTASAAVPMALMQIFGQPNKIVTVACQAELRIPNTDVMFVLDTTFSMGETLPGSSDTKITGLRRAVKCFYEALAKENIDDVSAEGCNESANPSNTNTGDVQLRFGFVPYSVNVNVGGLLEQSWMVDRWQYQSREVVNSTVANLTPIFGQESQDIESSSATTDLPATEWQNGTSDRVDNGIRYPFNPPAINAQCVHLTIPPPYKRFTETSRVLTSQVPSVVVHPTDRVTRYYTKQERDAQRAFRYHYTGTSCQLQFMDFQRTIRTSQISTTTPVTWESSSFGGWIYKPVTFDVSQLKRQTEWPKSLNLPLGANGTDQTIEWTGCIEERQTVPGQDTDPSNDYDPLPANAYDLDIDLVPNSDPRTQWAPHLARVIYNRRELTTIAGNQTWSATATRSNVIDSNIPSLLMDTANSHCPSPAKKVQNWTAEAFKTYVNSLTIAGNTYHDIGLLWGARILSPTGLFATANATPGKVINRHMVFMTDGETAVDPQDYSAYGVHWYDRRQTPDSLEPTRDQLIAVTDARTAALCKAIKSKNITLWVVSYGTVNSDTNRRLETCASEKKFFVAQNVSELLTRFKGIAAEISALRLTQ